MRENSLHSWLAWTSSDSGDTVVPEKGRFSEVGQSSCRGEVASAGVGVVPCSGPVTASRRACGMRGEALAVVG
jgi:hypothetical protein